MASKTPSDHDVLAEIPLDLEFTASLIDELDEDFDFDIDDLVIPSDDDLGLAEDGLPLSWLDAGDSDPFYFSSPVVSCASAREPLEFGVSVAKYHPLALDHDGSTVDVFLKSDNADLGFGEDGFPSSWVDSGGSESSPDSNSAASCAAIGDSSRMGVSATEPHPLALGHVVSALDSFLKPENALPSPESGCASEGSFSAGSGDASGSKISETGDSPSYSPAFFCIQRNRGGIGCTNPVSPLEVEVVRVGVKRKIETRQDLVSCPPDKFLRPEANSSVIFKPVNEDEEKIKARLMRNRESAQLSRQRKMHHVEGLENKVKCMSSAIAELNNKIAVITAENASLRQQLGSACPQQNVFAPSQFTRFGFPLLPFGSSALAPHTGIPFLAGSKVPLISIPMIKLQQPLAAQKAKKPSSKTNSSENAKKSGKTSKKVASVTFICFLFYLMYFGGMFSVFNFMYGRNKDVFPGRFGYIGFESRLREKALTRTNSTEPGIGTDCLRERYIDSMRKGTEGQWGFDKEWSSLPFCGYDGPVQGNISESMVASLFVPRKNKLVHIDGRLVIQSVLAGERSNQSLKSKPNEAIEKVVIPVNAKAEGNGLAVTKSVPPALSVAVYRSPLDRQRVTASASLENYVDSQNPSRSFDGPFQKWFREGISGQIFRSGMCTEVFRFKLSPPSTGNQKQSCLQPHQGWEIFP